MKKAMLMLAFVVGVSGFAGQAQALVTPGGMDGAVGGAEWAFDPGYAFYRQSTDSAPDALVRPGTDLVRATIIQRLDGAATDGIYVSFETLGPVDFSDADPFSFVPDIARFGLSADVTGDNVPDFILNIQGAGLNGEGAISATVTFSSFPFDGTTGDITTELGLFGVPGALGVGTGVEFFIPTGAFGSPPIPFPTGFAGQINAFDGGAGADDTLQSLPVPEPGTFVLMGAGLLGLIGYRRFRS